MNNSIIIAIILIILLTIIQNYEIKILVTFFLMAIIVFWITKNIYKSIIVSFMINLIFYLYNCRKMYEGFEQKEDIDVNKLLKELSGKKDDDITEDDVDKVPTKDNEYMKKSAAAQRETFRLIDTIKQLQDTVENLTPALKQGAGIIEQFKKLNLVN